MDEARRAVLEEEQDSIEYGHLLRARGLMAKDPDEALAHARARPNWRRAWETATWPPWSCRSRGGSWSPKAR